MASLTATNTLAAPGLQRIRSGKLTFIIEGERLFVQTGSGAMRQTFAVVHRDVFTSKSVQYTQVMSRVRRRQYQTITDFADDCFPAIKWVYTARSFNEL